MSMKDNTVTAEPQSEPLTFAIQAVWAIFTGSPREQLVYSFIAGVFAWISTAFSAGATIFLVFVFSITFLVGALRLTYHAIRER